MATVPSANAMMSPYVLEGTAESDYGVVLYGFHCNRSEYGRRLADLPLKLDAPKQMTVDEENGYILFLAADYPMFDKYLGPGKTVCYVREPHKFFRDLPAFIRSTKARVIDAMTVTGSLGSITLTLLYRTDVP